MTSPHQPSTGPQHRGDIDGLRAVAVLVVVAFHAGIGGFDGGFVGVDVFFVISGFLIMGLLLRELDTTGKVSLTAFWARRIRRLGPALTVVLLATVVASGLLLSALRWRGVALDAFWSSLYASNMRFALGSRGYFAEIASPSPLRHTWSLAVEEQFYLLWPFLVAVLAMIATRLKRSVTSIIGPVLGLGCVASFALSILLTRRGTPWAYYSLPSRWWEIGLGIGCAMWCARRSVNRSVGLAFSLGGVALLVAAMVFIGPTTPFPGAAALLPTVGTALLLLGGTGERSAIASVFAVAPLQWLGRLSYSWYLWHWPVLILADAARWTESTPARAVAALASLVPAALTHYYVERPLRFSRRLAGSLRWTTALSVTCIGVVALAALVLVGVGRSELRDPFMRQLAVAENTRVAGVDGRCHADGRTTDDACGPGSAPVMLIGDSHASHWISAFEEVADQRGLPLLVRTRGGCPPWGVAVAATGTDEASASCAAFLAETLTEIERVQPSLVVVAGASYDDRIVDGDGLAPSSERRRLWTEGVRTTLERLDAMGVAVGIVLDNPEVPFDPLQCLGLERTGAACTFGVQEGLSAVSMTRSVERSAAEDAEIGAVFDSSLGMCDQTTCRTFQDGVVVFSDVSHLTPQYTETQIEALGRFVDDAKDAN